MSKIKIITDSTSYITKEYAEKNNISIIPLNYTFDGITEKEGFPGEFDEFFNKLSSTELFPTTSQPSTGDILSEFEKAFSEDYDEIIAVFISSKLSGTYSNALLAKNMLEDKKIAIVDSTQTASNLRFLVEDAVEMVKEGRDSQYIVSYIENKKNNMYVYFTVDTLEYLRRGGRLSKFQSTVGSALDIKPIIELKLLENTRRKARAINKIINKIPEDVKAISVCHVLCEEEAFKLKSQIETIHPSVKITIDVIGPVIGCHLGIGGIGVCFY